MKVIVDSSVLFSALLREDNAFAERILLEEEVSFFTPRYAIVEIFKHKEKIARYSKCSEEILLEMLHRLLKRIQFIDEDWISMANLIQAWQFCKDVDEKDMLFVAMSLELNALLWTTDKKLQEGLQKKGFQQFYKY